VTDGEVVVRSELGVHGREQLVAEMPDGPAARADEVMVRGLG
jgi:hypothetical protein